MIYTAMHGMQRMSSFGQFRTMIGDEALNDFRDEDLVLNIEGLNVEDGCYTWYMSVKDKVADWYNMETGEALCCYKVTRKDELLQDIYLDEDIFPNSAVIAHLCNGTRGIYQHTRGKAQTDINNVVGKRLAGAQAKETAERDRGHAHHIGQ